MKKVLKTGGFLLLAAAFVVSVASCSKDDTHANNSNNNGNGNINIVNLQAQITSLPNEPLNSTELTSLSVMREEKS